MQISTDQRFYLGLGILILGALFCAAHIVRTILLKKQLTEATIKMYMLFIMISVFGVVAVVGALDGQALAALLGSVAGYALGQRPKTNDDDKD